MECVKLITAPRPQVDPSHGTLRIPHSGWKVEVTWNWILQTMLALKYLTTQYRLTRTRINHGTGLHTLHHLIMMEAHLTTQQKENAWLLLGQEEIPDLYAHLICAQLQDTDTNAAVGMAAVLEGHTQAVTRISRDRAAQDEIIYLSLSLLDMMCPRGWIRDKEATDDMPRWIHQLTGAGQWDFPNLMKFETTIMSGQPLKSSTMDDWSAKAIASWAPINCKWETLLHILLQHHPLGSLSEFRNNSMIALQQCSPHVINLTPHFFNQGNTKGERKSKKLSHLIHRVTSLQMPGTPKRSGHSYPCQNPDSHPARTGTSQRPTLLNELACSTSFVLTIYTIPYPQGHAGLQHNGHPPASTPFLFDKEDASPVHSLMHQSFSDNRQKSHIAEALTVPTLTDPDTDETDTTPTLPLRPRKLWASDQESRDAVLQWQRVILIQDGKDKGFTQAPIRAGLESTRTSGTEEYKGHVLEVLIEVSPTESIGNTVHKILLECYLQQSTVPALDTLHYTLGEFPSNLVWAQEQTPEHSLHLNAMTGRKMSLSCEDKLEWIAKEDSTILVFLPLPDTSRLTSSQSDVDMSDTVQLPGHAYANGSKLSNPPPTQQQLQDQTQSLSNQGEPHQKSQENELQEGKIPPSIHQIFVRIPDMWYEKGRQPTYTQTMPTPTSLDSLKEELSLLLSIPTHSFRIQYGGKTLTKQLALEAQGVTTDTTVWMMIGGLFGGADIDMGDSPWLASSVATPIHRPTQIHSQEIQDSIDEWIDRLRVSNPLTQDLATVNMLMTALNLTKDQATTAITEALNEGDKDKDTDVSRFQQVQEAFPDNFEQFLEKNDIPFPVLQTEWEAFSNSFKEHQAGIARHADFKINPARKHRLGHKASGQPKEAPKGKLLNETFTLSNLNILSAKPLITALAEAGFQPGRHRDITFRPLGHPRMGTGSATISFLRTEASDKALYELYVTRTKSLQIQGQDSQPTWHLHRSDLLAEIEEDSIVLEPSSLEAKRGFQFAIAMHRAEGVAETDILDNIMFHLAAAGLWQIAELHTLAKDTCMANLLTDKGQGRTGFLRTGVHCGGEKGQQGILSHLILNHENSTFSMDLMSTRNRLLPHIPGSSESGPPPHPLTADPTTKHP